MFRQRELVSGAKICGDYSIIKFLGEGTQAKIFSVEKNGHLFALKAYTGLVDEEQGFPEPTLIELDILHRVKHPNILGALDSSITPRNQICLVLELADEDLNKYIKRSSANLDPKTLTLMFEILCGLHYLHQNFIMHRDLKPENILLFKSENGLTPKIADFGISSVYYDPEPLNYDGQVTTPSYRAPELLAYDIELSSGGSNKGDYPYTKEIDVWSLGAIFYKLLTKTTIDKQTEDEPYEQESESYLILADIDDAVGPISDRQYELLIKKHGSDSIEKTHKLRLQHPAPFFEIFDRPWADFLSKILTTDPTKRPSTSSLLKDKLFKTYNLECQTTKIEYEGVDIGYKNGFTKDNRINSVKLLLQNKADPHIKFLSIDLFDRYQSMQTTYQVDDTFLSRSCVACFNLAVKAYNQYEYSKSKNSKESIAISKIEFDIVKTLKFKIFRPTIDILFEDVNVKKLEECYLTSFVPDEIYACAKN